MFKHILTVVTIFGIVGGVLCSDAEAWRKKKKQQYGDVWFNIAHECVYRPGYPRPYVCGEARHWDPNDKLTCVTFLHRSGNERADFRKQPVGRSRGDARVTVGWATCKNCQTDMKYYTVKANQTTRVDMTMYPR